MSVKVTALWERLSIAGMPMEVFNDDEGKSAMWDLFFFLKSRSDLAGEDRKICQSRYPRELAFEIRKKNVKAGQEKLTSKLGFRVFDDVKLFSRFEGSDRVRLQSLYICGYELLPSHVLSGGLSGFG